MDNRIRYIADVIVYKSSDNGPVANLNSKYLKEIRIYTLTKNFMKYNPPCKECLIQGMCLKENPAHPTLDSEPDHLYIKICDKLIRFISNNINFIQGIKLNE